MNLIAAIAADFWGTLTEMAPYLLFGFAVAGALSVLISPDTIERHLGKAGWGALVKASLFGVPLPLCSCSVIPVAASLRRHGAGRGATAAFLLSTPQTGVDSMAVTFSLLGPVFAVLRPIIAFVTGLAGGGLIDLVDRRAPDTNAAPVENCKEECCHATVKRPRLVRALRHGFVVLPRDIAPTMLAGLALAGLITALVPDDFFAGVLGTGTAAILVMMAAGIPIYVCATASVPIAAALIAKGVSPGAALAFLITGPATNAATLTTLWTILGRRATLIVLGTVAGSAFVAGWLLNTFFAVTGLPVIHTPHTMLPAGVRMVCAIALLVVLGAGLISRHGHNPIQETEG